MITVTPPSAGQRPATCRRLVGQASSPNAAQFWPGLIDITTSGSWRVNIAAGSDRLCVTVAFEL